MSTRPTNIEKKLGPSGKKMSLKTWTNLHYTTMKSIYLPNILTNKICVIFKFINHTFALLSKKVSSWCYELKSNCIKHHKTSHCDSLAKVDVALINYSEDKLRKPKLHLLF